MFKELKIMNSKYMTFLIGKNGAGGVEEDKGQQGGKKEEENGKTPCQEGLAASSARQ
jgi:hypothetical protein